MRRLTLFVISVILASASCFYAANTGAYPAAMNAQAPLILFMGLVYGYGFSVLMAGLAILYSLLLLGFKVAFLPLLFSCVGFGLMPYLVKKINETLHSTKEALDAEYTNMHFTFDELRRGLEHLKEQNTRLDRQVQEIARFYDVTKELSATLELDEMLATLGDFLKKHLPYSNAHLFIVKEMKVEQRFRLAAEVAECAQPVAYESDLLEILAASRRHVAIPSVEGAFYKERLKLSTDVATFMAVPMMFDEKTSYVLALENLPEIDFERFLVLAGQVSLELEKVNLYREVQELAIIDGLTGVFMRRYFMERFTEELARSARHGSNLSLLLLDMDYFKKLNDSYGHLVGDIVLKEMGNILKRNIREVDLLGRYGGEEFAIALTDTAKVDAYQVGERIRQAVEACEFRAYDETLRVTMSIGISGYPVDGLNPRDLFERSDEALYRAKESGRNRVIVV